MEEGNNINTNTQIAIIGSGIPMLLILSNTPEISPPTSPKFQTKEKPHQKAEKLNKKLSNLNKSFPKSFSFKRENYTHGKQYKN